MARILVTGDTRGIASRTLLERLVEHIRDDGHDAAMVADLVDPAQEVRDADAVIAILDSHGAPEAAAVLAYAHANRKPSLGVFSKGAPIPKFLRAMCSHTSEARRGGDIRPALQGFYDKVRPFAGRLVRDGVPDLVRAAGHKVHFRRVDGQDLPRFLKRKIAEEAQALDSAAGGSEKEELADLLEALEAFIANRGFDKDELKRVKAHKKEQRGGFEQGFVVETALTSASDEDAPPTPPTRSEPTGKPASQAKTPDRKAPATTAAPAAATPRRPANYEGPEWVAEDVVPVSDSPKGPAPQDAPASTEDGPKVWDI